MNSILICDDSDFDSKYLSKLLELEGYPLVTVLTDPRLVMQTLAGEVFDLLILDIEMPHINGVEVSRQIRERYSEAQLPILVVTGSAGDETRRQVLGAGANDYLHKPIDRQEMSIRVRNLLTIRSIYKQQRETEEKLRDLVNARTAKLEMLIKSGIMMSLEHDRSKLIRHILADGQRLLNCDAGTTYLKTERETLAFAMRTKDDALPSTEIPLFEKLTGRPNEKYVSTFVALNNKTVVIDDIYQESRFDLSGTRSFDKQSHYRTVSMLTVPMSPRNGDVVGVLQFINAMDPVSGKIIPFTGEQVELVEALAAQAAVALDNMQLVEAQKALVDNMIQVLATAIDAKSHFTGRHCSRVPELAIMLAEVANDATSGPLADFQFKSPDEWREFKIAAWLHDCGKVTTPEYVIDKATKLETIYNRIHEIRTRFEVLLRDAEIDRLAAEIRGENLDLIAARFAARKAALIDDFAFVAECNVGAMPMTDECLLRLQKISQVTWLRHFDDRLGLSRDELTRYGQQPVGLLPVREQLLADKKFHVIRRESVDTPAPSFGFKMKLPEKLYDYGEIYNLSIRRGTLTEEERYKINEHMVYTIMMLEQMKFPRSMRRVSEYAGNHHEGLHGHGYPRQLSAEELSIPSRIVAIADIFEALTAVDRPYKKPNTVSESLRILCNMKRSGQIDPDLFDLFLTSGTYLRYARQFVKPEQIDDVDIAPMLGKLEPLPRTFA